MKRQFALTLCVALALVVASSGIRPASAAAPVGFPLYVVTDLGTLGGSSFAIDINAAGHVVGTAYTAANTPHPFLYSNGVMTDLGTLGGSRSVAYQLNDAGQVVGWSDINGGSSFHGFLYSNGAMTDLGTLGGSFSLAAGINACGQVVGWAFTTDARQHAFLYSNGEMRDLNDLIPADSNWELTYAAETNAGGQIVGWGVINGQTHAFLLTPRSPSQLIDDLIRLVQSFNLPKGIENSLIVKLRNAQSSLAAGDTTAALDKLNAFINEVNAQAGKAFTIDQANYLLAGVNQVKTVPGCQ